jgi:hypothetical protein
MQTSVYVRNLSKNPRHIRILQPKTSKFKCDYDQKSVIAAGMAMTIVVYFETNQLDDFHDIIKIQSEDNFNYVK